MSLVLNVDVDVIERSEGGSVFQHVGACKEKALFCEEDQRRGGLSSLNWCIVVCGWWCTVQYTVYFVYYVYIVYCVQCTLYNVQCT